MHPEDRSPLFLYTEEEKLAILKDSDLNETSMKEAVDAIIDWFYKQPHLAKAGIHPSTAEMMILLGKGSIEKAKGMIDYFYKWRFYYPEFVQNRESILRNLGTTWNNFSIVHLPKLYGNRRIYIIKFGPYVANFDLMEFFKSVKMLLDLRFKFDYTLGDRWILDFEHVSWTQILAQNPLILRKMNQLLTKGVKWRIYGIHVINANIARIVQRVLDFFKQFFSSLVMSRVIVHDNLEELYKYVPKEYLPEDYGGNLQSIQKLKELLISECKKPHVAEYLIDCCKLVSDERLRPQEENNDEFLSGSFRKLEVD